MITHDYDDKNCMIKKSNGKIHEAGDYKKVYRTRNTCTRLKLTASAKRVTVEAFDLSNTVFLSLIHI